MYGASPFGVDPYGAPNGAFSGTTNASRADIFLTASSVSVVAAVLDLIDSAVFTDLISVTYNAQLTATSNFLAGDSALPALAQSRADAFPFSSTDSGWLLVKQLVADKLGLNDSTSSTVNSLVALSASLALYSQLFGSTLGALTDHATFASSVAATALQIASLLDSFSSSSTASGMTTLFGFLSGTFSAADAGSALVAIKQLLADGLHIGMTLFTGLDTYTAWVMTPETRAMRSYTNFPFNSYAHLGNRLLGALSDGIYELLGETDNGTNIVAHVRSGLLDFGSRQLKRMDRAYLGYTSAGTLAMRVTTTSPEGKKVDYTYKMIAHNAANAPRENRIQIGRGMQSVYWQFELDNSPDASRFELHDIVVLPMTLSRRVR